MEHFKQGDKIEVTYNNNLSYPATFISYYNDTYIVEDEEGSIYRETTIRHVRTKDEQIKLLKSEYLQKMEQLIDELNEKISQL